MTTRAERATDALLERIREATNRHDLDTLADCFHPDYDSEFPAHPERAFRGQEQMRQNWSHIFTAIPDLTASLVRSASNEDTAWAEWEWVGARPDGKHFVMRGVTIQQVRDGRVAWARLYMEPVQPAAVGMEEQMGRLLGDAPAR